MRKANQPFDLRQGKEKNNCKHDDPNSGPVAKVVVDKSFIIGLIHQCRGRVIRATAGEHIDNDVNLNDTDGIENQQIIDGLAG